MNSPILILLKILINIIVQTYFKNDIHLTMNTNFFKLLYWCTIFYFEKDFFFSKLDLTEWKYFLSKIQYDFENASHLSIYFYVKVKHAIIVWDQNLKKIDKDIFSTTIFFRFSMKLPFLLSSIYKRRKYWIRENFRLPVFDGFTCFEMRWTRLDHF